jgi:hypothetical protein
MAIKKWCSKDTKCLEEPNENSLVLGDLKKLTIVAVIDTEELDKKATEWSKVKSIDIGDRIEGWVQNVTLEDLVEKWCLKTTSIYDNHDGKLMKGKMSIDPHKVYFVINPLPGIDASVNRDFPEWSEIMFIDEHKRKYIGWVQDIFLENLVENPKFKNQIGTPDFEVEIDPEIQTKDSTDAAQFIKWVKPRHRNMCGQLCVAYIANRRIKDILEDWERLHLVYYNKIVFKDLPTEEIHLGSMLEMYDYPSSLFNDWVHEKEMKLPSQLRKGLVEFQKKLATHFLIALVRIDNFAGNIEGDPSGSAHARHWVVLDKITPEEGDRGWVEIYNPFPNKRQEYSFSEFVRSCGKAREDPRWRGLWVPQNP